MALELTPIDISALPELVRLAEEVRTTGESRVLTRDDEVLAVLSPVQRPQRKRANTGLVTEDDPLLALIGIGHSGIPGGVSGKKHEYLARAYRSATP